MESMMIDLFGDLLVDKQRSLFATSFGDRSVFFKT
jgi:hypothetical protein